jgi:phosphate starvation-inducible protein PhoH
MSNKVIKVEGPNIISAIFGSFDANAKVVERKFGITLYNRVLDDGSDAIIISGDDEGRVKQGYDAVSYLVKMARYNEDINEQSVIYICDMVTAGNTGELDSFGDDCICVTMKAI